MTPEDVAGPVITIETLTPWLQAIAPAVEPAHPLPVRPERSREPEPLRPAA